MLMISLAVPYAYAQKESATNPQPLHNGFSNPPTEARPKALWPWVNGAFSLTRITKELEEAKAKGMGGFDIWDVGSNMNPGNIIQPGPAFLNDESVNAIAHTVKEAGRLGLEIGLITSSSWNAGGAWVKPEHGAMAMFTSDTVVTGPGKFSSAIPFPAIPQFYGRNRKNIIYNDSKGLPVFYRNIAMLAHPLKDDSLIVKSNIISLPLPAKEGDAVQWNVPAGRWRIVRYVCAPTGQPLMIPSPNSNGLMLDHFSKEAQEANMRYVLDRVKTKIPVLKNSALKYLYEDSYEVNSAVWTPRLPESFHAKYNYSIVHFLPALEGFTVESKEITGRFTFDFTKLLSDLIIENHYATGRKISEAEGIGFHAEAGGPGKPIHNVPFEDLRALGALTVPRGEFWNKHPQLDLLQIVKGIASASHIYNQKYVEAEAFTSVWLWQEGPDELKPLADRAMCEGLNRFVYHTFPHTTEEAGVPGWIYNFGTLINTTNGWWSHSAGFHNYLARCSYLLQQGNFRGDVAFYYGDVAPNFVPPKNTPASLGRGYDYDVINTEILLGSMTVKDGKIFLPHGQYYEVLVLPEGEDRINLKVLEKIEKMIAQGAIVIGKKPLKGYTLAAHEKTDQAIRTLADRLWGKATEGKEKNYGKGKIVWGKTVREVLLDKGVQPDFEVSNGVPEALDYIHRQTPETDIYFIRNAGKATFNGQVTLRVQGKNAEWWNPVNGERIAMPAASENTGRTTIAVKLGEKESAFFIFKKGSKSPAESSRGVIYTSVGPVATPDSETVWKAEGPWEVTFAPYRKPGFTTVMNNLESWHLSNNADIRYFNGVATYKTTIDLPREALEKDGKRVIELNKVKEIAEVYLNGERLDYHWFASNTIDVTGKLKAGKNTLKIEVVNTIANALIGDAKLPEGERIYRSNITKLPNAWMNPFAEASPIEAGLLGPVVITRYPGP